MMNCEYLVSHGKSGGLGRFAWTQPQPLNRGQLVVLRTQRGLELGTVLCPAQSRHQRALQETPVGELLRPVTAADQHQAERWQVLAETLFAEARLLAQALALPLEILDVEVLFDGRQAIVQHLSWAAADLTDFVSRLGQQHNVTVLLENLAEPATVAEEEDHGGCGKPDCGQSAGGCTSCSNGGCSSCGSAVDLRPYFAHLRDKMDEHFSQQRTPLL